MTVLTQPTVTLAHSFESAADYFEHSAATLWDRFGRRLVARVPLSSGMHVLDAACGTGASAIPAAARIGRRGWVTAIDVAPRLLAIGRAKARAHGLRHLDFTTGDLRTPPVPDASQDVVFCGLGLHLVPDITEGLRALWQAVRPGGVLAFTTWGPRRFDPLHDLLIEALSQELEVPLPTAYSWERLAEPADIAIHCSAAGLPTPDVHVEWGTHPIATGEAWWELVLGTEYRPLVNRLDRDAQRRVVGLLDARLREHGIGAVETNVHYVTLRKE